MPNAYYRDIPAVDRGSGGLLSRQQIEDLIAFSRGHDLDPVAGHTAIENGLCIITPEGIRSQRRHRAGTLNGK